MEMDVGFIGLGHMGTGIARSLLKAGHRLAVYNRTRDKAEALAEDGAAIADSPAEAARQPVVMTMLANDAAVEAVVAGPQGILAAMPPHGIHVGMSTVSVALTRRLTAAHREAGTRYVAAPVFGRPDAAAAAKLFVAVAGPDDAVAEILPLLDAVGQKTQRFGDDPGRAALVKVAGNFMLQSAIEALAEALALVRKHGVDPATYLDFMTTTMFPAPPYKGYGAAIVEGRYEPPGFPIPLALKDTKLALEAAGDAHMPLPLADLIRARFEAALARGWEGLDQAALGRLAAEDAGLTTE
jgi:3-hydroxyisobutyrate dehydrogenase-like beta-hydroxyacid dehydrogenase